MIGSYVHYREQKAYEGFVLTSNIVLYTMNGIIWGIYRLKNI